METRLIHQGKVRDVYEWNGEILLIATDRISAFDVILPTPIPGKGKALTALSKYWFESLPSHIRHHVISFDVPEELDKPEWHGRITRCRRAQIIAMECIVRGYLAGSGWKDYQATGALQGHPLPEGLLESEELPEPLFTPSTKAAEGHDEPLTEQAAIDLVGEGTYRHLKEASLSIYTGARKKAREKGIIIADTKFEFGLIDGQIALADELLTPDSSRFWPLEAYEPGRPQDSFDKQYVRDYLLTLKDWNRTPPGPELPATVVSNTRAKYNEAISKLTGSSFSA